jgi:hypothetical protein
VRRPSSPSPAPRSRRTGAPRAVRPGRFAKVASREPHPARELAEMLGGDLVHGGREVESDIDVHVAVDEDLAGELARTGAKFEDAELRTRSQRGAERGEEARPIRTLIRVSSIQVRAVAGSRKSTRIGTSSSSLVMSHPFYSEAGLLAAAGLRRGGAAAARGAAQRDGRSDGRSGTAIGLSTRRRCAGRGWRPRRSGGGVRSLRTSSSSTSSIPDAARSSSSAATSVA